MKMLLRPRVTSAQWNFRQRGSKANVSLSKYAQLSSGKEWFIIQEYDSSFSATKDFFRKSCQSRWIMKFWSNTKQKFNGLNFRANAISLHVLSHFNDSSCVEVFNHIDCQPWVKGGGFLRRRRRKWKEGTGCEKWVDGWINLRRNLKGCQTFQIFFFYYSIKIQETQMWDVPFVIPFAVIIAAVSPH